MKLGELLHNLTELLQDGCIDIDADVFILQEDNGDGIKKEIFLIESDDRSNEITIIG